MHSPSNNFQLERPYKPKVHAPRSVWYEVILGAVTLTVSFCFWMVGRAKDIKNMRSNEFEPWLWCFPVFMVIAQPFAFVRFFGELKAIEGKRVNNYWLYLGPFWIVVLVAAGLAGSLPDIWEAIPQWVFWFSLAVTHGCYCLLHVRFNKLKEHDEELLEFDGRQAGYYWWEWLLIGVSLLLWSFFIYGSWKHEKTIIRTLPQSYTYSQDNPGYRLQIDGKGWQQVALGTYSDGSAEVEFGNEAQTAYLLVFKHGVGDTLNSVASFRYKSVQPDFESKPKCSEKRQLSADEKSVVSLSLCSSESRRKKIVSTSTLIEIDARVYELLGYATENVLHYKKLKETVLNAANSFSALPYEEAK